MKDGNFLIHDVLNNSFVMIEEDEEVPFLTDPEDESSPRNNESGWRHAIAVSNGQILEKEFEMSAEWLWLNDDNRPDGDRGYMYKVCKVYRIFPCKSKHKRKCKFINLL